MFLYLIFFLFILLFLSINYESFTNNLLNIYGEELKPCRNNDSDNNGSWDSQGYCSELDGGVHQICFNVNESTKKFSTRSYLISRVTNLPTIVDIDTGFKSCKETIETFEEFGISAVHL